MRHLGESLVILGIALGVCAAIGEPGLYRLAIIAFVIQWAAFVIAYALKTERFYDLVGGLTYMTLVGLLVLSDQDLSLLAWLLLSCVVLWAGRLSVFLALRVHRKGKDSRFDTLKHSKGGFFVAWTLQGLWVFLTPLPVWIVALNPVSGFGALQSVGIALWASGWIMEIVADQQKSHFNRAPENAGRFIRTGLWAYSRHPNYFGEIMLWGGVFMAASAQLKGAQ